MIGPPFGILDSVPAELHRPLLRSQLKCCELDQWARNEASERPEAIEDVASLVRQWMGLAGNSGPVTLERGKTTRHVIQLARKP